jgi:type VI secretion system secreted protein Hcp
MIGAGLALAASAPAWAAIDAYLYIDGIKGESKTIQNAIELQSFSWGASRGMSSPTGGQAGAPNVSEIVITKSVDSASPVLMKCAATGCHYPSATLYVRKAGGGGLEQYQLSDVMLSHFSSSGGERPSESITFNFTKIELKTAGAPGGPMATHGVLPPPGPAPH